MRWSQPRPIRIPSISRRTTCGTQNGRSPAALPPNDRHSGPHHPAGVSHTSEVLRSAKTFASNHRNFGPANRRSHRWMRFAAQRRVYLFQSRTCQNETNFRPGLACGTGGTLQGVSAKPRRRQRQSAGSDTKPVPLIRYNVRSMDIRRTIIIGLHLYK